MEARVVLERAVPARHASSAATHALLTASVSALELQRVSQGGHAELTAGRVYP